MPGTTISSSAVNSDLSDIASALTNSVAADGQTAITGQIKGAAGAVGTPSYSFSSSLADGFYLSGTHQIGVAINGALVATFSSTGIGGAGGVPLGVVVGTVVDYAGASAPSGWQLCYGQAVSRTTYSALFAIIGTTYGAGDGVTTFNLPDCRGRMTAGQDNMGGSAAGRITVAGGNFDGTVLGGAGGQQNEVLTVGQLPAHTHSGTTGTESATHTHGVPVINTTANTAGTGFCATSLGNIGTSTTESATHTHSITTDNGTGGGAAHPVLSPAIIFNKIIFAGA